MRSVIAGVLVIMMLGGCSSTGSKHSGGDEDNKDPAEVNAQLGIEYMRKGMYEASMEKLTKAVRQNPNLQLAQVSLAILYERLGEEELAEKHYKKAYSINRKDPVTLNAYGQYEEAERALRESLSIYLQIHGDAAHPRVAAAKNNLVTPDVYLGSGEYQVRDQMSRRPRLGEIYDRYMGPEGLAFTLPRELNNLWTEGGLIYAPPHACGCYQQAKLYGFWAVSAEEGRQKAEGPSDEERLQRGPAYAQVQNPPSKIPHPAP